MPYQPQPPMDANNTPGLAPRAQLPQNIEAEQSVLAACLLNGEVTEEAVMLAASGKLLPSGPSHHLRGYHQPHEPPHSR